MMTKYVKNLYFNIIEKHNLSHDHFDFIETDKSISIYLIGSKLSFIVHPIERTGRKYQCTWNIYAPGSPKDLDIFYWNESELSSLFENWIRSTAIPYFKDMQQTDLWEQHAKFIEFLPPFKSSKRDFEEFSDEEKIQIKQSISNYRILVIENYNPNDEQLEEINEKLDYISQAVERLNRRDWIGVAISTVIGIGINLAVDTEGGRQLFELFQEAFSHLIQLLP